MEFKIKKEKLLNILSIAEKGITQFTPNQYLSGIFVEIKTDSIIFITSDSHISIKTILTNKEFFEVKEEGKVLLEEKLISEITRKIESEDIYFESVDGDLITVYGGNSKFKLNVLDFENYPKIDFGSVNKKFKVNSCTLKTIVEKTAYACSEKEIQLNLTGINLFSKNGELHALATDRFKLASKIFNIDLEEEFNIVIPKKYFINAIQTINQDEVEIEIQTVVEKEEKREKPKLFIYTNESIIKLELIEDLFPDVTPVFKNTIIGTLIIKKNELSKMIDRCSLIKDDKNKTALDIKIENNKLYMSSKNNLNTSNEVIDLNSYDGENIHNIYDSKFLIDSLKVIDTPEVKIEFTKEKKAAILKNIDDESLVLIISPQKG